MRSAALPWLVLVTGLLLSVAIWHSVRAEIARPDAARFERLKERVLVAIDARFQAVSQALSGGRVLVETGGEPSPVQWARYASAVTPFFDEGVVGLGYVQRVPRADFAAVEARLRAAGRPEFTAERLGEKPEVFLVTEIEPLARNRAALGKDVGAGTTRAPPPSRPCAPACR